MNQTSEHPERAGAYAHNSQHSYSSDEQRQPIASSTSLSLKASVEAMIFATREPITISQMMLILGENEHRDHIEKVLKELIWEYEERHSQGTGGLMVRMIAGGYQISTIPEASNIMEKMFSLKPRSLSRAAQETLAIIAYREPVTRADIEYIRGVDVGSTLKKLLEQELITSVGRKEDAGRALLFATTSKFLKVYGLSSKNELPPLASFQPSPTDITAGEKLMANHESSPSQPASGDLSMS
ncbi:MAG: SMC-Scp complex subunit ScpB [Proteobacteria bacterium]|nr:SMC-Scp complex subunit ScpB [Pseudomonadota bacterium]